MVIFYQTLIFINKNSAYFKFIMGFDTLECLDDFGYVIL